MRSFVTTTALAILFAAPALAQDAPFCGGISLVGDWIGGDAAGSDVMASGAFFDFEGQVPIAGHLVSLFTLSQPGKVRLDVSAIPNGDPYVALYDESGSEVGSDDDGGGNFASSMTLELEAGTYCLASRSYESGITDVSVQIGQADAFPEGQDIAPQPTPFAGTGGCGTADVALFDAGTVSPDLLAGGLSSMATLAQIPAYEFDLTDEAALTITATSDEGDPLIRLRDASGGVLAENDDADGLNSRIELTSPLPAGRYCIELEDLNGSENPITVSLSEFDPVADRQYRLGLMEMAPTSSDDVAITDLGELSNVLIRDVQAGDVAQWFRFSMPQGGLVMIEAVGSNVDPEIRLFDRVGREIAYNDDGPTGLDSLLVHRGQPGSYLLGMRILDSGSRGNVRVLLERYIPAP